MEVQVRADIRSVKDFDDHMEIRGYQNYNAYQDRMEPIGEGKQHKWAITIEKWKAVDDIVSRLDIKTYADLGCNLGLYVFSAVINHDLDAYGYDYDIDYINVCEQVKAKFALPCTFDVKAFSDISNTYDCVSALGLIHHLYQHTEAYGSLEKIINQFSKMTDRYLILEFPTEKDPKAIKWINLPGRIKQAAYSEAELKRCASKDFKTVRDINRVSPHRPIFLMEKRSGT